MHRTTPHAAAGRFFAAVAALALLLLAAALPAAGPRKPKENEPNQLVDLLGPFLWARASDANAEHAVFADPNGRPARDPNDDRSHMLFSFDREGEGYKRSNLTSTRPQIAYGLQLKRLVLGTSGAHNCKIMLGYMNTDWRFTHGDDNDLVHWASRDRVVLFVPVRHRKGADPNDPNAYHISPYGGQTISVLEFKAGELIRYEWFRNPRKLDRHVLLDLHPYCGGKNDIRPAVNQPMFTFEVFDKGRWRVRIEPDGRDGLSGGDDPNGWDMVFTEKSRGAKPYTVKLGRRTAFSFSVYHPSGGDPQPSKILLKPWPFRRGGDPLGRKLRSESSDARNALLPRTVHIKDIPLRKLPRILKAAGRS